MTAYGSSHVDGNSVPSRREVAGEVPDIFCPLGLRLPGVIDGTHHYLVLAWGHVYIATPTLPCIRDGFLVDELCLRPVPASINREVNARNAAAVS
jgi:hypothetical protein